MNTPSTPLSSQYPKLVRDEIPNILSDENVPFEHHTATHIEIEPMVRKKIREEAE